MPTPPLSLPALVQALGDHACRFDADLIECCDSTNRVLMTRAEAGAPSGSVVIATAQTAGRGRLGRQWIAAPGDSLTFSLLWRFPPGTLPLGLSLAVGLAVANALEKVGAGMTVPPPPIQLKWPNDLLVSGKKLGGILIELVPGTPHAAVIGIGLNLQLPAGMPPELRARSAALGLDVNPNAVLAVMLVELTTVLDRFATGGFACLRDAWSARHAHADAAVQITAEFTPARTGICRGIDTDGALLLEVDGGIERVLSGDVSLRPA